MYHRDYPSDWDKPKFFFGQTVSLKCITDSRLWWGFIRGMHYSHICNAWTYEILISPHSYLLDYPDIPEIMVVWNECSMILRDS